MGNQTSNSPPSKPPVRVPSDKSARNTYIKEQDRLHNVFNQRLLLDVWMRISTLIVVDDGSNQQRIIAADTGGNIYCWDGCSGYQKVFEIVRPSAMDQVVTLRAVKGGRFAFLYTPGEFSKKIYVHDAWDTHSQPIVLNHSEPVLGFVVMASGAIATLGEFNDLSFVSWWVPKQENSSEFDNMETKRCGDPGNFHDSETYNRIHPLPGRDGFIIFPKEEYFVAVLQCLNGTMNELEESTWEGLITCHAFTRDGSLIVATEKGAIYVLDDILESLEANAEDKKSVRKSITGAHDGKVVHSLTCLTDRSYLLVGFVGGFSIFDLKTLSVVCHETIDKLYMARCLPDSTLSDPVTESGHLIVTVSAAGVQIWNTFALDGIMAMHKEPPSIDLSHSVTSTTSTPASKANTKSSSKSSKPKPSRDSPPYTPKPGDSIFLQTPRLVSAYGHDFVSKSDQTVDPKLVVVNDFSFAVSYGSAPFLTCFVDANGRRVQAIRTLFR
eukprot:PhF_6_TR30755/c0_g1_i1/m.45291